MKNRIFDINTNKWKIFSIVSTIGFIIDFYTKYLASTQLQFGIAVPVIGNVLQFQLVYNKGALFGLNPQSISPAFPVNLFFYIISAIAIVILLIFYRHTEPDAKLTCWGTAFIMPGALGNLFDRIIRPSKGVVDFIKMDFHFWPFNPWPNYNMADAYITVGLIMIITDMFIQYTIQKKTKKEIEIT